MTYTINLALLLLLIVAAASATFLVKELLSSVFILGSYSFFLALLWAWLGAVDVAFVEAVIGAGLATVLFLITLFDTAPKDSRLRRPPPPLAGVLGLPLLGLLLLFAANDLPKLGDATSPASVHISPVYLEQSLVDTRTPNVVASVLMDYRGLDTLIETVVIFTAGIACAFLLRNSES